MLVLIYLYVCIYIYFIFMYVYLIFSWFCVVLHGYFQTGYLLLLAKIFLLSLQSSISCLLLSNITPPLTAFELSKMTHFCFC